MDVGVLVCVCVCYTGYDSYEMFKETLVNNLVVFD